MLLLWSKERCLLPFTGVQSKITPFIWESGSLGMGGCHSPEGSPLPGSSDMEGSQLQQTAAVWNGNPNKAPRTLFSTNSKNLWNCPWSSSLFHNNGTFDIFSTRPIAIVLFALKGTNLPCCLLLIYLFLPDVTKKTLESLEGQGQSLRGGAREVQSWIRAGVRGSCHSSPGPRDQRLQAGIGPCGSSGPSQNKLSPSFTLSLFCRIQKWKGLETPMRNI